jgi:RNA polymerase sigma factor (sigma-70 family)
MPTAAGRALTHLADAPDAALLARFVRDRDEPAFAALVRRHGPMVLGVCRRVAGDRELADDAFQAAFLVLARKAATVSPAAGLAGWLHGVARRAALEARTLARRRAARETPMPTLPDRPAADPDRPDPELLARLDRAVARLPEGLRAAVVLCELEGRSRRAAARLLGIPEGTLSSRLAAARKRLAAGLRRTALPTAGLTVFVPAALADRAIGAALYPNTAPARVAAVAAGVSRMLVATRLKAIALAAVAVIGLGLLLPPNRPADAAPRRAESREPEILYWVKGKAVLLKPDGTVVRSWEGDQVPEAAAARLSPDGTRIAIVRGYETRTLKTMVPVGGGASLPGTFGRTLCKLTVVTVADKLTGPDVEVPGDSVYTVLWSGDGTKLYAGSHDDDPTYAQLNNLRHWVIDAKTLKATELKLPAGHHVLDVSADGKFYLTRGPNPKPTVGRPIWVVPADGSDGVRLTDTTEGSSDGQFSPDGTRVLLCGVRGIAAGAKPGGGVGPGRAPAAGAAWWLDVVTISDGKRVTLFDCKSEGYVPRARWSPDGKQVAYLPRKHTFPEYHEKLTIANADGTGAKVVFEFDRATGANLDWR